MSTRDEYDELAAREADRAAAEAAEIGGQVSSEPSPDEPVDQSERSLAEAGEGEAEGFEQAERELMEHSTHGDQHAARRAIQDAPSGGDDARASESGEADHEYASERKEDLP